MESERDLLVGVGVLVAILLVIAFGAVGLLWRMRPAIEQILAENETSVEAVEEMCAVLARTGSGAPSRADRRTYDAALLRARHNIHEDGEEAVVEALEANRDGALAGQADARAATLRQLRRLSEINRSAMRRADERAKQFVAAGCWAGVVLAFLGLVTGSFVVRYLRRRLLRPFREVCSTLDAVALGDAHRRCQLHDAPAEAVRAMTQLNEVLDRAALGRTVAGSGLSSRPPLVSTHHRQDPR
jgi:hypothetical protein